MKKFGAYLSLIGLLSQATALAWVGGPYSNNTFDGFDGGIFGGTIRGSSTSGIFKFSQGGGSTNPEPYVSPFGDSIVYHKGMTYYGECYGMVDFDSKTVSGITNGSSSGANVQDPSAGVLYRNLYGTGFGVQNGAAAATSGNISNTPTGALATGSAASTVGTANSSWNGKITRSKLTMRFEAKGEMSFFGNSSQVTEYNRVSSTGVFENPVNDPNVGINITGTSTPPGTGTTVRVSGATNNFPDIQSKVKIRVYGSRTSIGSYAGPTGYLG